MTDRTLSIDERLRNHPHLRERFAAILAIVEDAGGEIDLADEAERQVIAEVRQLGNTALHDWAVHKESQKNTELRTSESAAKGNGKKNSTGTRRSAK